MMLAMKCTLPSLRTWGHENALPVLDLCKSRRCKVFCKRRSTMDVVRSQPQRDVGNLTAPFVSSSVDGNTPESETFLEQVAFRIRLLVHVTRLMHALK